MNEVKCDMSADGMRLVVTFPYDARDVKAVKFDADADTGVPGARFRPPPDGPAWVCPRDMTSARRLREAFGDRLVLSAAVIAWGREARDKENALKALSDSGDENANLDNVDQGLRDWMRNYQRAGAAMMSVTPCINADEPGTGKTVQTLASILQRSPEGQHLIVAPKTSLDAVWGPHIEAHTDIPYVTLSGADSQAEREEVFELIAEWFEDGTPFFLVTNPATVNLIEDKSILRKDWPVKKGKQVKPYIPKYPQLFEHEWDTVVFDEYHLMGLANDKTISFQAFNMLKAKHKNLLSGTPMGGKPVKLWGALHFLEPESFTSKWRWIDQWLETEIEETPYGTVKKPHGVKSGREDAFWEALKPYMLRRTKAEVIKELPPKQYIELWAEMTPKQKTQYEKFAADAEMKIDDENLSATGILAEYTRLKQFSNAHQKVKAMGNGKLDVRPTYESGKLPMFYEQVLQPLGITKNGDDDEGDDQVVFFSQSSKFVDMVQQWLVEEMGIACEKITGDVTQARRTELVERFQAGGIRVIGVTTTAGGTSLTLDKASTAVIFDETWSPDDQTQASDRLHRASRIHQVMIYVIRSRGTIEERIRHLVQDKEITNREILDLRRQGLRAI